MSQSNKQTKLVISMKREVKLLIQKDEQGNLELIQGEFKSDHWQQGLIIAANLRDVIAVATNKSAQEMQMTLQYVKVTSASMQPQVWVNIDYANYEEKERINKLAKAFLSRLSDQLKIDNVETVLEVSDEEIVSGMANNFLKTHGESQIKKDIGVQCDGQYICTLTDKIAKKPASIEKIILKTITGFYNGRKLRQRILWIIEATARGKEIEVNYDEEVFNQEIAELREDKLAKIKVEMQEKTYADQKPVYTLTKIHRA